MLLSSSHLTKKLHDSGTPGFFLAHIFLFQLIISSMTSKVIDDHNSQKVKILFKN